MNQGDGSCSVEGWCRQYWTAGLTQYMAASYVPMFDLKVLWMTQRAGWLLFDHRFSTLCQGEQDDEH